MTKTTIQLDKSTKDEIDDLVDGKNYDRKVQKIIEGYKSNSQEPIEDYSTDLTPVLNRLDDLENTLPRKVREELRS